MRAPFIREHHGDSIFEARTFTRADGHGFTRWYINGKVVPALEWERLRVASGATEPAHKTNQAETVRQPPI